MTLRLLGSYKKTVLDAYTRRARLQPALLVALPLGLIPIAWFPSSVTTWGVVWGIVTWCGGTALLAQVARDRGKRKEPGLFASWGGKPTTRLLRHRDNPNAVLLQRRHAKLQSLVTGVKIPTPATEAKDPKRADEAYEACVAHLLERTRSQKRFPLVFNENCNYGFRRNLWGMKPVGIVIASFGTALTGTAYVQNYLTSGSTTVVALGCGFVNVLLLLGWIFWFTPEWVRIPAEAYAERLLAACEDL